MIRSVVWIVPLAFCSVCFSQVSGRNQVSAHQAVFFGNPYKVGPIVSPTTTTPQAEETITINPSDPSNLIGIIMDYSVRPNGSTNEFVISSDHGTTWTEQFIPLSSQFPITGDGVKSRQRTFSLSLDDRGHIEFSRLR